EAWGRAAVADADAKHAVDEDGDLAVLITRAAADVVRVDRETLRVLFAAVDGHTSRAAVVDLGLAAHDFTREFAVNVVEAVYRFAPRASARGRAATGAAGAARGRGVAGRATAAAHATSAGGWRSCGGAAAVPAVA